MLSKCANPICPARFRYLHEGRIFNIEIKTADRSLQRIEHFWLCESCARTLKVVWNGGAASTLPLRLALTDGTSRKAPPEPQREVA